MMDVFCDGCGMCCKIIPVKNGDNILLRNGFQIPDEEFLSNLYELEDSEAKKIDKVYFEQVREIFPDVKFCGCKNLSEDNICKLDEKPAVCRTFPSAPLSLVPDKCAYLGTVFIQNEQLKRKIRMIKEEILDYESLISNGDKDSASYKKIIENLTRFITKYKDFGSENW